MTHMVLGKIIQAKYSLDVWRAFAGLNLSGWHRHSWAWAGFLIWPALQRSLLLSLGWKRSPCPQAKKAFGNSPHGNIKPDCTNFSSGIPWLLAPPPTALLARLCVPRSSTGKGAKNSYGRIKSWMQLFNKIPPPFFFFLISFCTMLYKFLLRVSHTFCIHTENFKEEVPNKCQQK